MAEQILFQYHADVVARFPTIIGGMIYAKGLTNSPTNSALNAEYEAEQKAVLGRLNGGLPSDLPPVVAWRRVFRGFGTDPTKYRNAAESLMRRLSKQGNIPCINTLVDIGNLISIRYALPISVMDTRAIHGILTVHFASGAEAYTTLGQDEIGNPENGEVVFSDENGLVFARRWCWRQSEHSAARLDTTTALITIEAQHDTGRQDVEAAIRDFKTLLDKYSSGTYTPKILDARDPVLTLPMD